MGRGRLGLPLHAHWLPGEPTGDVVPMSGVLDRYRRLPATGVGRDRGRPRRGRRGLHEPLARAGHLVRPRATRRGCPRSCGSTWTTRGRSATRGTGSTEDRLTPVIRATVALDRGRRAQAEAIREGRPAPEPATPAARATSALLVAVRHDPDVFRGFLDIMSCLALPQEVMARPGFAERVSELAAAHDAPPPPGPTREQLLALLA